MEKYIWGNSKGAVNLITMLETAEYSQYFRAVSSIISKYFQSTGAIKAIADRTIREAVLLMWHAKFVDRVTQLDIPEVIKTHMLCVGKTRNRQARRNPI